MKKRGVRSVGNTVPGTDISLGPVIYKPVRGPSRVRQGRVATLLQYAGAYDDAVAFVCEWIKEHDGAKPDVEKAEPKTPEWYAGMILGALEIERTKCNTGDAAGARLMRDAVCALFGECVVYGAALPVVGAGVRKLDSDVKRAANLSKQNRATATEAAERTASIIAAAKAIPELSGMRKTDAIAAVAAKLDGPASKDAISRAIRGYRKWQNSAEN